VIEAEQERRWQDWILGNPVFTDPEQRYSLSPQVELIYGDFTSECLKSERGLVQYVLRFANGNEPRSAAQQFLEVPPKLDQLPASPEEMLRFVGADPTDPRPAKQLEALRSGLDELRQAQPVAETILSSLRLQLSEPSLTERRQRLRDFLSRVESNHSKTADEYMINEAQLPRELKIIPIVRRGQGTLKIEPHYIIGDADAFEEYARVLFLGSRGDEDFGRDLCRCNLATCDGFFLRDTAKRRGAPKLKYCPETDHGDMAHKLTEAKRQFDKKTRKRAVQLLTDKGVGPRAAKELVKETFKQHTGATPEQLANFARKAVGTARKHK
jgi:hypothetical protein